jgi:hypothetical protein
MKKNGIDRRLPAALAVCLASSAATAATRAQPDWPFEANDGRFDATVAYVAHAPGTRIFVTHDGRIVYGFASRASVVEKIVSSRNVVATAVEPAATHVSDFRGNDASHWRSDVATFRSIDIGQPWRGVRMRLVAHERSVEKIFTLAPRVDAGAIRIDVAGSRRLRVDDGELVAETVDGELRFGAPIAYQEVGGVRHSVDVRYRLEGAHRYSFALGAHDATRETVIDPLVRATFAGGSHIDDIFGIVIDPATGDVIVAGRTNSPNFPGVSGGAQSALASSGFEDAFVARYDARLRTLIRATYLGGSANDEARALALDPASGDVYIAGWTDSKDFPGTAGGAQATAPNPTPNTAGSFVARLSGDLTTLHQATYLGGAKSPQAMAIAIQPGVGIYVAGDTGNDFPADGFQTTASIGTHAFVALLSSDLAHVTHATYFAGSGNEAVNMGLAVDAGGDVVLAGKTESIDLPGTAGGAQPSSAGNTDAYLARFDATLGTLRQATYLGGSMVEEYIGAVIIDPVSSDVFITGETVSPDFPGTTGGLQPMHGNPGNLDIFVSRLNAGLTTLRQSTYIGVDSSNYGRALALDPKSGDLFLAGESGSHAFPGTAFAWQPALQGNSNVIVARMSADLTTLRQSTYLGASQDNQGFALAIGPDNDDVYVAGLTTAPTFPGTAGSAQPSSGSPLSDDGFVARITADLKEGVYADSFEK